MSQWLLGIWQVSSSRWVAKQDDLSQDHWKVWWRVWCNEFDEDLHTNPSPLSGIVKMISKFCIDYMHLCYLGVTRKWIHFWLRGKNVTTRQPSKVVSVLSVKLVNLRAHQNLLTSCVNWQKLIGGRLLNWDNSWSTPGLLFLKMVFHKNYMTILCYFQLACFTSLP